MYLFLGCFEGSCSETVLGPYLVLILWFVKFVVYKLTVGFRHVISCFYESQCLD